MSIGGAARLLLEDLGSAAGLSEVTGAALIESRRQNFVVNREPSFSVSWTGEKLDMPNRGLLSRVMCVATRSRLAFAPLRLHSEREIAFLVSAQSTPPSARVFNVDGGFS